MQWLMKVTITGINSQYIMLDNNTVHLSFFHL